MNMWLLSINKILIFKTVTNKYQIDIFFKKFHFDKQFIERKIINLFSFK